MPSPRVIGVDEAGRGPILGPMALAAVAVDDAGVAALEKLGVQDSKRFGSGKKAQALRGELAETIASVVLEARCVLVPVPVIDARTLLGQLNHLERDVAVDLLEQMSADHLDRIICDGARLFAPLKRSYAGLEALDRGESAHVAVAAASILAKHARDQAFSAIESRYEEEFGVLGGGGYINAPTKRFLEAYRERYGDLPPEARRSWGAPKDAELAKPEAAAGTKPGKAEQLSLA
ncbi:MAG: hypothetical protein KC486_13345 [Myxococcales bacterium]|nr:hypothetical protein [Myxococcales bacterium]